MNAEVAGDNLRLNDLTTPLAGVLGFHERFDPWSGRVWLDVNGPDWSFPVDNGYHATRHYLRQTLPGRPYTSDWAVSGRFPCRHFGINPAPAAAILLVAASVLVAAVAANAGVLVGTVVGFVLLWPWAQVRAVLVLDWWGIRLGPAWVPHMTWDHVHAVCLRPLRGGRDAQLFAISDHGVASIVVPSALLPPIRARLARLGGLPIMETLPEIVMRYAAWRAAARGGPWGVFVGSLCAATLVPDPMWGLGLGLALTATSAFVGAAIEARITGWRAGGLLWMTLAWGAILAILWVYVV